MSRNDYPLNCIDDTGDGFSGWFAISNKQQCNDFCYWSTPDNDVSGYTAFNTADPHQTTVIDTISLNSSSSSPGPSSKAYWVCIYDAADDKVLASRVDGVKWIDTWQKYSQKSSLLRVSSRLNESGIGVDSTSESSKSVPFPYLRCQKGAGERLKSWPGEAMKSSSFWRSWIVISSLALSVELVAIIFYLIRKSKPKRSSGFENFEQTGLFDGKEETENNCTRSVNSWDRNLIAEHELAQKYTSETDSSPRTLSDTLKTEASKDDAFLESELSPREVLTEVTTRAGVILESSSISDSKQGNGSDIRYSSLNQPCNTRQSKHLTGFYELLRRILPCFHLNSLVRRSLLVFLRLMLFLVLNFSAVFIIFFSTISLMEIESSPSFTEDMENWTPACSNPDLTCLAGNQNIFKYSMPWISNRDILHKAKQLDTESHATYEMKSPFEFASNATMKPETAQTMITAGMKPFSYLIASDAQLYWFNGEFSELGTKNIPSSCSPKDSCGRCTGKHGYSANLRLKKAWEDLMTGSADGMEKRGLHQRMKKNNHKVEGNESVLDEEVEPWEMELPLPSTLIMNGDLTAYFHPHEKRAYDSIYNNVSGLHYYFPSLGNHDLEHMGGAKYGGDQWLAGPPNCNMEHAISYFKSGFCGNIPKFDTSRIVRYDASSLAYSWDEGRYHFVHTHYFPTYEMASVKYRSSMEWLERDLTIAKEAGLVTILFVHAVQGLNVAMEKVILGKNVMAIVAGHTHRCLHRRCEGLFPLNEDQVKNLDSLGTPAEKCIPAAYDTCKVMKQQNLFYVKDMGEEITFPTKKLSDIPRTDKPLCPKPAPSYINETDNSLLCRRALYSHPNFPSHSSENTVNESIPIFWSGSSSFETFLRADFFEDRFVINAMTAAEEDGVARYIDVHDVPNARYPHHEQSDLDEVVIFV